jgi:hypothetical protein
VPSNYNPKTIAILELVRDILERGEQVLIVCARVGQTDELERRLTEAFNLVAGMRSVASLTSSRDPMERVPTVPTQIARIDSTMPPDRQSAESARFKRGEARVLLMGIKCAKAFSYESCPNAIIGSLEYSYGSLHQAKGRVWRVNSVKPVTIYCVLHKATIEETMFDIVSTKQDAATICLHGQRVPRDFQPVDLNKVLAQSRLVTEGTDLTRLENELDRERTWPALRLAIARAIQPLAQTPLSAPARQTFARSRQTQLPFGRRRLSGRLLAP